MKYAITGCNGYIGRHVVEQFEKANLDYVAVDYRMEVEDATHIRCDLFDENTNVYELLGKPEVIVHLAWRDGFNHKADSHMTDLSKHYSFIKRMIESGAKQIVVMGTMHEVGYYEGAIDENTPCNPMSKYGIAKNALRQALTILCNEKNIVLQWVRAYYIYGDNVGMPSIFGKLWDNHLKGIDTLPFTSGKNQYDFISVDELAYQIMSVASQSKVAGIINCCSGKPLSLGEMVEQYIKDNNLNVKLEYGAFPDRPYDSPCVYGDATKINQILERNK